MDENILKIKTDIESEKEVLSVMPKNNEKNKAIYIKKIEELKKQYIIYKNQIEKILKKRFDKVINIKSNKEIENLQLRLDTIEKALNILNEDQTSYEKMGLDKNIYNLEKYYKSDFNDVNEQIYMCIIKFENVGVYLKSEDFNYSIYTNEYMKVFFDEKNKIVNSAKLKEKFDQVYWKCPEIITHITLNLRNIYFEKESEIDKFFEKEKNEILKQWGKSEEGILEKYYELKKEKMDKKEIDKKYIIDKFLKEKINVKNYTDDKFKSNCLKIMSQDMYEKIDKDEKSIQDIKKFLNSLYEYKNIKTFLFIVEDVKKFYINKDNYKKMYQQTKSEINKKEKELKKASKNKGLIFFRKNRKGQEQSALQVNLINEISQMYKKLDLDKFSQKASETLNENSTIYDVLKLTSEYYDFLVESIMRNEKDITQEEIEDKIISLNKFLHNPYNTIINNITITEEKDVAFIIKDKYKLLNFNVEKEDFAEENIDSLISTITDIQLKLNMKKAKVKLQDMEQMVKIKKLLNLKY